MRHVRWENKRIARRRHFHVVDVAKHATCTAAKQQVWVVQAEHRPKETPREPAKPVYGPFADDFRTVLLPEHGHINLTEAQASVFQSLWSFKGEPMRAERIMERAGLDSDKPIDVFKVKSRDKGKPGVDRPLIAYRKLVNTQKRQGLYAMPCASGQ
ncbi:hypothetical protein B9Z38_16635 [Limnohabitans sp. MMS-10A-160]|nr:hypothetical protein B9Z38_16635 [Limnohabitans sp. MMS-10A-160]